MNENVKQVLAGARAIIARFLWSGPALDKPETVGAAMKWLIKQFGKAFTRSEMKTALEADADWSKLLTQSPSAFAGNLIYWAKTGKLKRTGEGETEKFEVLISDF